MLTSFKLVLIKGHKDTRAKSGKSYDTITLAEIAQMAEVPNCLCKLDAPALIASTYNAPDARSHAAQREHGCFHAFVLDVDEGNTSLKTAQSGFISDLRQLRAHSLLNQQCDG